MIERLRAAPLLAVIFAVALTACAHQASEPNKIPAAPAAFRETDPTARQHTSADMPENGEWWLVFADPTLDDLIRRADRGNFTVGLAAARLAEARAIEQAVAAAQWPTFGLSANATREEGPLTNAASSNGPLYIVGGNLSYEADLFGRFARETKAAATDAAEREALLRAANLLVQADIAQTYFTLRALDAERALVRGTAAAHRKSARLTEGLVRSGLASELTLVPAHRGRIGRRRGSGAGPAPPRRWNTLAVLVGEAASTFQIALANHSGPLPNIPPGIPGAVLVRRPDVEAARRALIAAEIRTGVAQDRWLPTLSLDGVGGFASSTWDRCFPYRPRDRGWAPCSRCRYSTEAVISLASPATRPSTTAAARPMVSRS
jgi:multidrug efflux system outer membrane protein